MQKNKYHVSWTVVMVKYDSVPAFLVPKLDENVNNYKTKINNKIKQKKIFFF